MIRKYFYLFTFSFLILFFPFQTIAQAVQQGNVIVEGYAGFVSIGNKLWEKYAEDNAYNVNASFDMPWGVRAEYAFHDRFSAGIEYNYISRDLSWTKDDTTGQATLVIAPFTYTLHQKLHRFMPRITAHLSSSEKVDVYVGFALGLRIAKYETEVTPNKPNYEYKITGFNPLAVRIAFGVKFYPIKNVGLFLELGSPGGNLFHSGLSLKF